MKNGRLFVAGLACTRARAREAARSLVIDFKEFFLGCQSFLKIKSGVLAFWRIRLLSRGLVLWRWRFWIFGVGGFVNSTI
jgi:hypothetical protein